MAVIFYSHNPISEESYNNKAGLTFVALCIQGIFLLSKHCPSKPQLLLQVITTSLLPWPTTSVISTDQSPPAANLLYRIYWLPLVDTVPTMLPPLGKQNNTDVQSSKKRCTTKDSYRRIDEDCTHARKTLINFVQCSPWQKGRQMQTRLHARASWTSC